MSLNESLFYTLDGRDEDDVAPGSSNNNNNNKQEQPVCGRAVATAELSLSRNALPFNTHTQHRASKFEL